MGAPSTAALAERFETHLRFLDEQVVKPNNISATQKETQLLPRTNPAGLLTIPAEIRLQIYHYCLPRRRIVVVSTPCFHFSYPIGNESDDNPDVEKYVFNEDGIFINEDGTCNTSFRGFQKNRNTSLLLVSKQISEEALEYLYGENIFKLSIHEADEYHLRKNFSEQNIRRMRYLLVIAVPMCVSYGVSYARRIGLDNEIWSWVLPNLTVFRLLAQQPSAANRYQNVPTLAEGRWIKWIKAYLECFGQHLQSKTSVEVDVDDRKEIAELVQECLPNGYQKVRCKLLGDHLFKRGHFTCGSGFWAEDDYPMNSYDV